MTEYLPSRPGWGQWLILLTMAFWLAVVPLGVTAGLSVVAASPPDLLVQLGLVAPGAPALPEWATGLIATAVTLFLQMSVFLPLYAASRKSGREFLRTAAGLLTAIALVQTLNALAVLASTLLPEAEIIPAVRDHSFVAALRLAMVLTTLMLGLGWVEARRQDRSLLQAWRRMGVRLWANPSALWLALGVGAVVVWPWVLVGSLGSPGTMAANLLQALPNSLIEEALFRGVAFAWLWRAGRSRRAGAIGSLILYVAAQGGTVLPSGDWIALLRFPAALFLGLLATELTIRSRGSIWPAVVVHLLYDWFHFAFVDIRSLEEALLWLAQAWAPVAEGGLGLLLWIGRKVMEGRQSTHVPRRGRSGLVASIGFAGLGWAFVGVLYLAAGAPGFHPDGFIIFLEEQADLGPGAAIDDPVERRDWVYRTLVETADRSQMDLRAELDRRDVAYRAHYLVNAIEVLERPGLRRWFAQAPGVEAVLFQPGVRRYPLTFALPDMGGASSGEVEWNVRKVGADQVWALGYTGQGVIVGDADTGVDWEHPALKEAYLGWDDSGNGSVAHDYHWYDPWDGSAEPWDDNGHGTHTTGTVVGSDGDSQVGVAPGARWIACRNMRHGLGNPGSYLSCMEFLLAPYPLSGDPLHDGDPGRGAHVVNNSWGCPRSEGCLSDTLRVAVESLRAAGQMMVVSAGNDGPACGSVEDPPATYDAAFSVGAIDNRDRAAGFSSRGPVVLAGGALAKPDIVAPGVNIRGPVPGGYASLGGTSMAGPHVAGAVALLWSVDASLIGDVHGTEQLLIETAQRLMVDAACPSSDMAEMAVVCGCAGDGPDSVPNLVYGWGQVDALSAVSRILDGGQ